MEWENLSAILLLPPAFPWRKPIKPPLYWASRRSVPKMKASGLPLLAVLSVWKVEAEGSQLLPISRAKKRRTMVSGLSWSNLLFFFPIFWTKLWCRVPELGGSLSGEAAVRGALQGCSLPGLLSRLGLRVWGLYMLTKAHWKSLSRQGTLPLTHAKSVWLKPRVLGVC